MKSLDKIKVNKIAYNVTKIKKNTSSYNKNWKIYFENNHTINQDYIVVCSALNTKKLLKPLGYEILLEPILGQVIELKLENMTMNWENWPAVLNYQSTNFIHNNNNNLIIGATLENGIQPSLSKKKEMLNMSNDAPKWMKQAKVANEWSGIRARPTNEASPLLKEIEHGLFINTGHYRNGILLAPACAEWIGLKIENQ